MKNMFDDKIESPPFTKTYRDGITTELLEAGSKPALRELQKLFNTIFFGARSS